jgi:predicted branched-subunit amino acid permease
MDATYERRWPGTNWVVPLFGAGALFLVPWVVLLAVTLPSHHRSAHWDVAWVGLDVLLAALLLTVAVTAWRRSPWLEGAATATAALLFVDAWFDVLTSSTRVELVVALLEATLVELPLALVCLLLARAAEHRL